MRESKINTACVVLTVAEVKRRIANAKTWLAGHDLPSDASWEFFRWDESTRTIPDDAQCFVPLDSFLNDRIATGEGGDSTAVMMEWMGEQSRGI